MSIDDLPSAALRRIAEYINEHSPFRDQVDVAIDAVSIAIAGLPQLASEVNRCIDPSSRDGRISECVRKNIQNKKKRSVSLRVAKRVWNLSDDELKALPNKVVQGSPIYCFQDVKKMSASKFGNSYEQLKSYRSINQLERLNALKNELSKMGEPLRLDSHFCNTYITHGHGNPSEIAKALKEMSFYHTFTDYYKFFLMYVAKYHCEYGYYDRNQISNAAKKRALCDFVARYPEKRSVIPESLRCFAHT